MPEPRPRTAAPALDVAVVDGERFVLADQRPEHFILVVFYRGLHCPICRTYLTQLQRALPDLKALGTTVIAVSGDTEERARQTVDEWKLTDLVVGYGQTPESMREWGLYLSHGLKDPEPALFGEPGIYLIDRTGDVYMAALNSMPAARPRIEDVVGAIKFFVDADYPARGEA
ncbi:MAG TPA: peroxiredoxin-like family protein [Acidimicrobiales bacterium]|nr:peroxiredoxin-like family protein [Acidimicrobiales bacterium]